MKVKMVFFGLLVAAVALNALPVYATDFSGYVESTKYTLDPLAKLHVTTIEGGAAVRLIMHYYLNNLEAFPLTDAILVDKIVGVGYNDDEGKGHTTTDPAEIAQFVRIENSEGMWQGGYVIWVGTVELGGSKRVCINWWISSETNWILFECSIWYLP